MIVSNPVMKPGGGSIHFSNGLTQQGLLKIHGQICSQLLPLKKYVSEDMYAKFALIADEEEFERAADTFRKIIVPEKHHEQLYLDLAENIATNRVFEKDEETLWRCLSCGYIHKGKSAPEKCPACVKPANPSGVNGFSRKFIV